MLTPLRIVFFGTPLFAVATLERLLESAHPVVGVVTQPDRPRGRGQNVSDSPVKAAAIGHHLPLLQPDTLRAPDVDTWLRALRADLGVVAAYGKLIPERLLAVPRLGMINVHGSLLPRYRGAAPVHRAVMAGERETGATIMRVTREFDAGAMFAKCTRPIGPDETSEAIERDLAIAGAALLVSVVDEIAQGTSREEPQDDSQATYAPRLTKEEGLIDWSRAAQSIHDQVRGLYPWPHAFTFIDGSRVIVLRTRTAEQVSRAGMEGVMGSGIGGALGGGTSGVADVGAHPTAGTVTDARADGIHVAAGDGRTVIIESLQLEGRRPTPARDFLAGHPLVPGTLLGQR